LPQSKGFVTVKNSFDNNLGTKVTNEKMADYEAGSTLLKP